MSYDCILEHTVRRNSTTGRWELTVLGVVSGEYERAMDCYEALATYAFRCALSAGATVELGEI
jgi:hypothetical protein